MTIKVYTPGHTLFAALQLIDQLQACGHSAFIVTSIAQGDKTLYIIYCANYVKEMPVNYILYQTEAHSSKWFTPAYKNKIKRARAVWEYCEANKIAYEHSNIHIVRPGTDYKFPLKERQGKRGVLFYGKINKRRRDKLNELSIYFDIEKITDSFENKLWERLKYSPVVINLHYYENAPLEVFRLNEALSYGCDVVSEPGDGMERYKNIVYFEKEPGDMVKLITYALKDKARKGLSSLDNTTELKIALAYSV